MSSTVKAWSTPQTAPLFPFYRETRGWDELTLKQACCQFPGSAICVQRFDDSLNSAIHITYRSSLRSSSMHEPRDPPLKVVYRIVYKIYKGVLGSVYLESYTPRVQVGAI